MTPQEALDMLACDPEDSIALGFLGKIIRRDWAVRVLDAWAEVGQEGCETGSHQTRRAPIGTWICTLWEGYEGDQDEREWKADSADSARLAAAEAVWPELPESVRTEIGERP